MYILKYTQHINTEKDEVETQCEYFYAFLALGFLRHKTSETPVLRKQTESYR